VDRQATEKATVRAGARHPTDAMGHGMGGVFFIPTTDSVPAAPKCHACMWRAPFPASVVDAPVTDSNPAGTKTDLRLAAGVAHHDVTTTIVGLQEARAGTLRCNTPALCWSRKGSATTAGPDTHLLHLQALHHRLWLLPTAWLHPSKLECDVQRLFSFATPARLATHLTFQPPFPAAAMEAVQPSFRSAFRPDLLLAQRAVHAGVVESCTKSADNTWELWLECCQEHSIDLTLAKADDPMLHLQVFAARIRNGRCTPSGKPTWCGSVADAPHCIGQADRSMGAPDADSTHMAASTCD